ncbi:hypothetical protein NK718_13395 [Alsobacter sp. SYSU M60028]|uniref:Uncharacterized protein n=1 Tax=Alsobacter ponti TaxID=2962936 RepID=A0ABT1LFL1_9HYPH|nr:hypothetical protein [Alsobacter ponti]MCP8939515.1 hypothetical protein [Alsobacter ponti]
MSGSITRDPSSLSVNRSYTTGGIEDSEGTGQTKGTTSSGVAGTTATDAPPVDSTSKGGKSPELAALLAMFGGLPEASDSELAEVIAKLKKAQDDSANGKVEMDTKRQQSAIKDKEAKLKEADAKQAEANEKSKSVSIWDKIKLAFQALAAAFSIFLGAIVAAIPGAQALGALMIAGGIVGLVSVINDAVKMATGAGILGNIAKACGGDETAVMACDIAFGAALAITGLALGIASGKFDVSQLAGFAAGIARVAQQVGSTVTKVVETANAVGSAAAAGVSFSAAEQRKEAKELQAGAKRDSADLQGIEDQLDLALQMLMRAADAFNGMMDALTDKLNDRGEVLSHAKLTA